LQTKFKTVRVPVSFEIKSSCISWSVNTLFSEYTVNFRDEDSGQEGILPVNKEFMKMMQPLAGQNLTLKMEITICP
jgi:hypothetical protein